MRIGGWCILFAVIALVGWGIGATIYGKYEEYKASLPDYSIDSQVISDYSGILETTAAETTADGGTTAETAAESQAESAAESQAESVAETQAETAAETQAETAAETAAESAVSGTSAN